MSNPTEICMSTLASYKNAAIEASKSLLRNWKIIPGAILAYIAFMISGVAIAPMGFIGGFILGLIHICLLSLFYSWLTEATDSRGKLSWQDLFQFDGQMFFNTLGVAFIYFLVLIAAQFTIGKSLPWMFEILLLVMFLVFNPVAEVIYKHRFDGTHALSHAAGFIKDNWVEWFIPLVVLMAPAIYLNANSTVRILANTELMLPAIAIVKVWGIFGQVLGMTLSLIGILIAIWFMIFRGFLFTDLDGTSRRQRVYKWKNERENG